LGCDQAQGYLFGAAMPASSLPAWKDALDRGPAVKAQDELQTRIAVNG